MSFFMPAGTLNVNVAFSPGARFGTFSVRTVRPAFSSWPPVKTAATV